MLPIVESNAIQRSIDKFDAQLRDQPDWQGWELKASQKYAIESGGKLYPPKQIVSMATGKPVSTFSGGPSTNSYLQRLGYKIINLAMSRPPVAVQEIPIFSVGKAYTRKEQITGRFGGSSQSGIAPSNQSPAIFLFTGGSGEQYGYADAFDEVGSLLYTGEGQVGDMTMTRGNFAIASHSAEGRALHVFETTGKGNPCLYKGEFVYGSHFIRQGPDRNGNARDVIVFRLIPVSNMLQAELAEAVETDLQTRAVSLTGFDLAELRKAAIAACSPLTAVADSKETVRIAYQRSAEVKRYVLARAKGRCELCGEPAPFNRKSNQTPYLEPHHINRLSDGGLDHPLYVGAICPTCHRWIHFGTDGASRNEQLRAKVEALEAEVIAMTID